MNEKAKSRLYALTVLALIVVIVVAFLILRPRGPRTQCVTPPPVVQAGDRSDALALASKLESLNENEVEVKFTELSKTYYAKMSDVNTTLLILINGANCMKESGKIGEELARKLIDTATALALAKYGIASTQDNVITRLERRAIESGLNSELAIETLQRNGYKLSE